MGTKAQECLRGLQNREMEDGTADKNVYFSIFSGKTCMGGGHTQDDFDIDTTLG